MTERTHEPSPETGKPNPVSLREIELMDRKESRVFVRPLSAGERQDFILAVRAAWNRLPLVEKRKIAMERVVKLEKRQNRSIGDKLELAQAKWYQKRLMLPEKKPIFFRKFRSKEPTWPKWAKQAKSPYLIAGKA